ncbi:MAG: iron transporter, partial [Dehalococcoidia bacterium]
MCKIVIPITLIITLLQWTGWLNQLEFLFTPVVRIFGLPPEAAIPIITGAIVNPYAVIAVLTVIPFSIEQMTLIAIFSLIAHSLILEGLIQHRSGLNIVIATLVRLLSASLAV